MSGPVTPGGLFGVFTWLLNYLLLTFCGVSPTAAILASAPGPLNWQPQSVLVNEFAAYYTWSAGSVATADSFAVIAPTGGVAGRWILLSNQIALLPIGGGSDDWPRVVACATSTASVGASMRLLAGAWVAGSAGVWPNNSPQIYLSAGANITSTMAVNDGHHNSPFYWDGGALTHATTLNGAPTVGSTSLTLTSATGYAIGADIYIQSVVDSYFGAYTIINLVGTVVTVDRPILKPFASGANAYLMSAGRPRNVVIRGEGATISGTGDRAIQLQSGIDCIVSGLTINSSFTSYGASFDAGSTRCLWDRIIVNFVANTQVGLALEENEYSTINNCEALGAFTAANIQFNSCESCEGRNCKAIGGAVAGIQFANENGYTNEPIGNRNCNLFGCCANGNGTNGIDAGNPVQLLNVVGCTTTGNQYGVTACSNGSSTGVRVIAHKGGKNTQYTLVINGSCQVDGCDVPNADTVGGVLIQQAANVQLKGLAIDGGSPTPANWNGVKQAGTGTVTITGSDIRGSNSSTTIGAVQNTSTGLVYVDSSTLVIGGSGGVGLWSQNGPIDIGSTANFASSNTPSYANSGTPFNFGTFTLNGTTQVEVDGTFPIGAVIALSLKTVGGTPGLSAPYFSTAQAANKFYVKSPTPAANDVYRWIALGQAV